MLLAEIKPDLWVKVEVSILIFLQQTCWQTRDSQISQNKKHEELLNWVKTDIYPLDIISHYYLIPIISQCKKTV